MPTVELTETELELVKSALNTRIIRLNEMHERYVERNDKYSEIYCERCNHLIQCFGGIVEKLKGAK